MGFVVGAVMGTVIPAGSGTAVKGIADIVSDCDLIQQFIRCQIDDQRSGIGCICAARLAAVHVLIILQAQIDGCGGACHDQQQDK